MKSLARALSPNRAGTAIDRDADRSRIDANDVTAVHAEEARGRRVMVGRGGAGNQARSPSSGEQVQTEAEERAARSRSRTREDLHTGRGGAGNVRSPSRMREDPATVAAEQAKETAALKQQAQAELKSFHAAGRGGAGNITKTPLAPSDD